MIKAELVVYERMPEREQVNDTSFPGPLSDAALRATKQANSRGKTN